MSIDQEFADGLAAIHELKKDAHGFEYISRKGEKSDFDGVFTFTDDVLFDMDGENGQNTKAILRVLEDGNSPAFERETRIRWKKDDSFWHLKEIFRKRRWRLTLKKVKKDKRGEH